jgi:TPR repeat protein
MSIEICDEHRARASVEATCQTTKSVVDDLQLSTQDHALGLYSATVLAVAVSATLLVGATFANSFEGAMAAQTLGDNAAARKLFGQAADEGIPAAAYRLGLMYRDGQGVGKNLRTAISWYRRSADAGYAAAEIAMGDLYAKGQGVPKDAERALAWYQKAADQGDVEGEMALAHAYRALAEGGAAGRIGVPRVRFDELMNQVFGSGKWRETGGYRSAARENELRAEGAMTVAVGHVSSHSLGTRDAPGAYDVVVAGMTPEQAAGKLRRSGARFKRLFPEGLEGSQGPHLHVEPELAGLAAALGDKSTLTPSAYYQESMSWLDRAALQGDGRAERELAQAYGQGQGAPRNAAIAGFWRHKAAEAGAAP